MKRGWNPWPIGLALSLLCVLVGVITFSIFAQRHAVDLVTPEYYEEEIAFQQQIDRRDRTAELTRQPTWNLDAESQTAVLQFQDPRALPVEGTIHLYRPSDSSQDRKVPLTLDQRAQLPLDLNQLSAGLWVARLTWTHEGQEFYLEERWELPVRAGLR